MVLLLPLIVVFAISLLGLTGGFALLYREKWAKSISKYLINFAVGAMLGVVFLDILPETLNLVPSSSILMYSLIGIITFYLLEKTLFWYHHHSMEQIWHKNHTAEEKIHPVGFLIMLGDALHNFIDGLIIGAAFLTNFALGMTTSIAVLFHELPEEVGIFAVLIHAKFKRTKIIVYNIAAQLCAVIGALVGLLYLPLFSKNLTAAVLAFAAGSFIYIANTDLLPETHREKEPVKSLVQIVLLLIGVLTIWFVTKVFAE